MESCTAGKPKGQFTLPMNTKYCFENAEMYKYPAVFSGACIDSSERLKEQYGEQETHQVIYETVLTQPESTCDISFRVDTGKKPVGDYWLEFDYAVYASEDEAVLTPCKFLDASCLKSNRDPEEVLFFLEQDLKELITFFVAKDGKAVYSQQNKTQS